MDNVKFCNMVRDFIKSEGEDPDDSQNWSELVGCFSDKVFIPNWFNRFHFIEMMDREDITEETFTEEKWLEFMDLIQYRLNESTSGEVEDFFQRYCDEELEQIGFKSKEE